MRGSTAANATGGTPPRGRFDLDTVEVVPSLSSVLVVRRLFRCGSVSTGAGTLRLACIPFPARHTGSGVVAATPLPGHQSHLIVFATGARLARAGAIGIWCRRGSVYRAPAGCFFSLPRCFRFWVSGAHLIPIRGRSPPPTDLSLSQQGGVTSHVPSVAGTKGEYV